MERHFTDGTEPTILPHYARCTGPCQQGRMPCPTPEACELAHVQETEARLFKRAALLAAVAVVLSAMVAAWSKT